MKGVAERLNNKKRKWTIPKRNRERKIGWGSSLTRNRGSAGEEAGE